MNDYCKIDKYTKEQLLSKQRRWENNYSKYATLSEDSIRKYPSKHNDSIIRNPFEIDTDKIVHNVTYNRYTDKTQVFSFYKNDDITRRALHVQLVSRIARIIGKNLGLNLDLIEAIALGHDIGHTPFGHKGEEFLSEIYNEYTGRFFNHNVHSVRVLKEITASNLTLQTYDGILCHCGEKAFDHYEPAECNNFQEFEKIYQNCYIDKGAIKKLRPSTLEGCVVRISDMIAYVGKDRQDANKAGLVKSANYEDNNILGNNNADIINNLIVNIIKNSLGHDYLKMDEDVYEELVNIQKENYKLIYEHEKVIEPYYSIIQPMTRKIYERFLEDIENRNYKSPIYLHHLNHSILGNVYREYGTRKIIANPHEIIVDYIASMTDDYFIDLFNELFPDDTLGKEITYISYFE